MATNVATDCAHRMVDHTRASRYVIVLDTVAHVRITCSVAKVIVHLKKMGHAHAIDTVRCINQLTLQIIEGTRATHAHGRAFTELRHLLTDRPPKAS